MKVPEVTRKKSNSKQDEIIERMKMVRSSGFQDANQLHEDAKRLVDWKAYVQAKPLLSVAVVSLIGFAAFRRVGGAGTTKSTLRESAVQPTSTRLQIPSAWQSKAIAIASEFAQASLKKYLLSLVQREVLERAPHDKSPNVNRNPSFSDAGPSP